LASILKAAGYRVGLYTSPHLLEFTERIQVDGKAIAGADVAALTDELCHVIADLFPTPDTPNPPVPPFYKGGVGGLGVPGAGHRVRGVGKRSAMT
ncbi:MAG: hypothetical protein WBH61_12070, partial [Candidatus Methylomirabilis sp.]